MKNRLSVCCTLLALALSGCAVDSDSGERPVVAVSVPPQAWLVDRIAGDLVRVVVMVPPGASPASWEPTVAQLTALSDAVAYFKIGRDQFPFEQAWLHQLLEDRPEMRIIDGSTGNPCGRDDPHIWGTPDGATAMAGALAEGLSALLPEHRSMIASRLDAFSREAEELDRESEALLAGTSGRKFLVQHPAWGCFAERHGLEQLAIEHEGKEPSAAELARLIDTARAAEIRMVFVQPQFGGPEARTVAREIGAEVVSLDPLAEDWPEGQRRVARALAAALGTR